MNPSPRRNRRHDPASPSLGKKPDLRRLGARRLFALGTSALLMLALGCGQSDVRGTYRVEIEISSVSGPITGTLILSTGILDVPAITAEDQKNVGDWFESDTLDANSCFVLEGGTGDDRTPQNVRVFEAHISGGDVELPIEIYRTPLQHLEIVELQFFAETFGGDVILYDRGQQRSGRIHGVRLGRANPQKCLDDLQTFREILRSSLSQ